MKKLFIAPLALITCLVLAASAFGSGSWSAGDAGVHHKPKAHMATTYVQAVDAARYWANKECAPFGYCNGLESTSAQNVNPYAAPGQTQWVTFTDTEFEYYSNGWQCAEQRVQANYGPNSGYSQATPVYWRRWTIGGC